jgi:hypothetical protein
VSTRTVIEVNHDYMHDLVRKGHLSEELAALLTGSEIDLSVLLNHQQRITGVRFMGRRHHSEDIQVECGDRVTYTEKRRRDLPADKLGVT